MCKTSRSDEVIGALQHNPKYPTWENQFFVQKDNNNTRKLQEKQETTKKDKKRIQIIPF